MNSRWILTAVAVVAVGTIGVSLIVGESGKAKGTQPVASGTKEGPACKPENKANLEFTVKDMNGSSVRLTDYQGKVILLNYWATWCGPCKVELPALIELYDDYKDKGFVVLGVSADDDPETLRAFAAEWKMNYPVLVGRDHEDLLDAFGPLFGYPTSYFIGRDGSVCGKHFGPGSKEDFEKTIKALL
jgi:peroxiredoxin